MAKKLYVGQSVAKQHEGQIKTDFSVASRPKPTETVPVQQSKGAIDLKYARRLLRKMDLKNRKG